MEAESLYPEQPILIVDDEQTWMRSITMSLKISAGITNTIQCTDSRKVESILDSEPVSLILLDLTMPYLSGKLVLEFIGENYPDIPVIIISGVNQIETAIDCIKSGAADFYVKTDERQRVVAGIRRTLKQRQLRQENLILAESMLRQGAENDPAFADIITASPKMQRIFTYLSAISNSPEPVMITGESGVGKELIAKALHSVSCPQSPWVAVNVAGLDDIVFSDTLFGHIKGAFTGAEQERRGIIEEADSGILFLDEIGDLSLTSQIKLLRLLQEGEYYPLGSDKPRKIRARILVATNQDLKAKETQGTFRRDLLYRLWAHKVEVPALRDRKEDLSLLIGFFLEEAAQSLGKKLPTIPPELLTLLATYSFPGNIRELRSLVYDAVSVHQTGVLSMKRFKDALAENQSPIHDPGDIPIASHRKVIFTEELPTLKEISHLLVTEAMQRAKGKQTIAARLLGVSHQALSKRLQNKS